MRTEMLGRVGSVLLLWAVVAACTTTRRLPREGPGYGDPAAAAAAADWRYQAPGWDKLAAIEDWQIEWEGVADDDLWLESVLQLAEGRVDLARKDQAAATSGHGEFLELRLSRADRGFLDVLAHPGSRETHRSRARRGRTQVEQLRAGASVASALPAVVGRAQWGAAAPIPARMNRHATPWSRITVHHSAVSNRTIAGTSFGAEAGAIQKIQRYHQHDPSLRWGDIGYHYLIAPSGRVFEGRQMAWQGAHVKDKNPGNIGVCLLGDFTGEQPTSAAMRALEDLVDGLRAQHGISNTRVHGHLERNGGATACPGDALIDWVKAYRR